MYIYIYLFIYLFYRGLVAISYFLNWQEWASIYGTSFCKQILQYTHYSCFLLCTLHQSQSSTLNNLTHNIKNKK